MNLVAWGRGIFKPKELTDGPLTLVSSLASSYEDEHLADDVLLSPQLPKSLLPELHAVGATPFELWEAEFPATEAALANAGLTLADIDVIELNEAFAAQALAVMREWKFTDEDMERTNVHGSGISLGHPVGATGVRMPGPLARELHRSGADEPLPPYPAWLDDVLALDPRRVVFAHDEAVWEPSAPGGPG